ncbi:uncharacterized protein N7484_006683 [Penicillium longicatenatum]|uniref:uncharacterized protein n=1 Tax=Penicillium longicatenatum TaxID=1561947 RepID=UPI0025483C1A|nr:uncharacterized protein N7484_006683 [Penicillium longicatenatum]KAJ5644176.1 hypothetical protein N7484_006683 [Penicillium longicatenatum]
MSNIIHKVKDTIAQHKEHKEEEKVEKTAEHHTGTNDNTYDSTKSSNHGPHGSNTANKADPRIDSDRSNLTGSTSGNYGPHDSKLANEADPRVDSDLDGRAAHNTSTATGAGYGSTGTNHGTTNAYDSARSSNYGPHDSKLGNAVDPRVDSDLDSRGAHNTTTGYGSTGPTAAGAGYGSTGNNYGTANTYDSARSSNYGPHGSNVANEVDPRVDSDRDGRAHHSTSSGHGAGYAATGAAAGAGAGYAASHHNSTHAPSTGPATSTSGPHSSNVENKVDPRVDSDTPNDRYSASTGPASSTAGPHKSNVANEADPRVDSDRSNATFVGGDSRFDKDVHKASLGGGDVMHLSGNKAPTTTQTFEKSQHESLGSGAAAGSSYNSQKTVGPHSSDTANKLDPRVDSDLDGSKTVGSQRV